MTLFWIEMNYSDEEERPDWALINGSYTYNLYEANKALDILYEKNPNNKYRVCKLEGVEVVL